MSRPIKRTAHMEVVANEDEASEKMVSWSSIRTITAPLTEPFDFWPVKNCPVWAAVKSPHVLWRRY